jgi:hypothetical protein
MAKGATATFESTDTAALATMIASAPALVAQCPECFWFWRHDVRLVSSADVRLVVQNLRKFGYREAWTAAQHLDRFASSMEQARARCRDSRLT